MTDSAELNRVLGYRHPDIIDRFSERYGVPPSEADLIFGETLKWLWLCAEAQRDRMGGADVPALYIDRYLLCIDEMWHMFILHTRDYDRFCHEHFGFFVHHNPTPSRTKSARRAELRTSRSAADETLRMRASQYAYIHDKLGADTLELWYSTLATRYWDLSPQHARQ